ncbi:hypothetical protein OCU04_011967 [Sclerotinia nivalis]|uniref:Carbohydrate esterase family 16 protein n=1 Tax=Sclerotinia nivalis TaxID=352851 RepID=A0A9X0A9Z3_9HELO|nr:hypothetical protein OCU04_011967 [Sclerotinia nivalis]
MRSNSPNQNPFRLLDLGIVIYIHLLLARIAIFDGLKWLWGISIEMLKYEPFSTLCRMRDQISVLFPLVLLHRISTLFNIMMNNFALLALIGCTLASPTKSIKSRATTDTKYLFSFGDSYSQTGFDITGTKPSADNPIGNPAFPGYTSDNGINWIGHLVETYNSSLILSYNFAYGGAVVDASIVTPYESTVLTLINQTAEFIDNLSPAPTDVAWTADNSLFALWFGVNDIGNSYWLSNETDVISAIFDKYFAQAQLLYNAGGRNFLFLNCPPIDKSPMMLAYGDSVTSLEATVITAYNTELRARVATFKSANTGLTTYVFDTQVPFNNALNAPATYGATNATCFDADGTTCLWFNNLHPGQAIQKLVAEGVAEQLSGTFFQASSSNS